MIARVIALGVGSVLLTVAPSSAVSLIGTVHDLSSSPGFSASVAEGPCGACHVVHNAREIRLWGRDADQNGARFNVGNTAGLCYDCHSSGGPAWTHSAPVWAHTPYSAYRLSTSRHDMTKSPDVAPDGSCSACHTLHLPSATSQSYQGSGAGKYITNTVSWPREIATKLTWFTQKRDLATKSTQTTPNVPNYVVGKTLLCYDCHSGNNAESVPDTGAIGDFRSPRSQPQDIATVGWGDRGRGHGMYMLADGAMPGPGQTSPSLLSVKNRARFPGGHFVQSMMNMQATARSDNFDVRGPGGRLLYRISIGDKLPCELCHDPHSGAINTPSDDEVFFRRNIQGGLGTVSRNPHTLFTAGNALKASTTSRNGSGDGRLLCFYCHGSSDWDGSWVVNSRFIMPLRVGNTTPAVTIYGIKINTTGVPNPAIGGSSRCFPPPRRIPAHAYSNGAALPRCTQQSCHPVHDVGASCSGCHDYPPTSGAHNKHFALPPNGPGLDCQACHGPNPGAAGWHANSPGAYSSTDDFSFITLMPELTPTDRGSEEAYYNTTWTRVGYPAPTVTKAAGLKFVCNNVACHGMLPVKWTWSAWSNANPASSAGYQTCGGCHGMGSDSAARTVYTSSFRSRSGSRFVATATAANYAKPLSGFSRGGHGDLGINAQIPFIDTAIPASLPVACGSCHSGATAHLPPAAGNPYRMSTDALGNSLPGANGKLTRVSNLCTMTNCHPKYPTASTYGIFEPQVSAHRHGSDHYPISGTNVYYIQSTSKPIIRSGTSTNADPRYNPVSFGAGGHRPVGIDIDRYVDDWQWWGTPATLNDSGDGHPFMPLGDSLTKSMATSTYNNQANSTTLVTCITCHNPHGTDLFVSGQTPGSSNNPFIQIPDNKMLRLRYEEGATDDLCNACH
jgi:hypothetical protein